MSFEYHWRLFQNPGRRASSGSIGVVDTVAEGTNAVPEPGYLESVPMPTAVALVPARSGSERVPGKNILPLAGHPLIAYTIAAARASGLFAAVVVSTDSEEIAEVARRYGGDVPGLRPAGMATATSPDIEWVLHVMGGRDEELFSILRPTSPFRTAATIRRAWEQLLALGDRADSIRAVEPTRQHPGKMWTIDGELMRPLLPQADDGNADLLHADQGAAAGLRPELQPRDRVVACPRGAAARDRRRADRPVPDRGR